MGYCYVRQYFQRFIVQHIPLWQVLVMVFARNEQAAVTMIGVFAQAHIRDDDHFWQVLFDGSGSLLDDAVRGKILQPDGVFLCRDAEEKHRWHAQLSRRLCRAYSLVHG